MIQHPSRKMIPTKRLTLGDARTFLRESLLDMCSVKPLRWQLTYVRAAKTHRDFLPRNPISAARKYQAKRVRKNI